MSDSHDDLVFKACLTEVEVEEEKEVLHMHLVYKIHNIVNRLHKCTILDIAMHVENFCCQHPGGLCMLDGFLRYAEENDLDDTVVRFTIVHDLFTTHSHGFLPRTHSYKKHSVIKETDNDVSRP